MARHVVLLRGVNVGGVRIAMAELRRALTDRGYGDVVTYLQSGNAVVTSRRQQAAVAGDVAALVAEHFGYDITVLVRSAAQLAAVVEGCPFDPAVRQPYVTLLADPPDPARLEAVAPEAFLPDRWAAGDGVIYLDCPDGYGRTKLANPFWERKLKVAATTRNWKTLTALIELGQR